MSHPSVYEHYPALGWRLSHAIKRSCRRLQAWEASGRHMDAIYLERGCLNDNSLDFDRRFRKATGRLILDVDDGIFLKQPEKIDALIAMSDHCVVSNEWIGRYVRQRHALVTVIPTAVPMSRFTYRGHAQKTEKTVVGWIGTRPNLAYLSVCAGALRELAKQYDFELLVVAPSSEPLADIDLQGVSIRFERWAPQREIDHLHQMDIGLMPLPGDDPWTQYKAATKLIQYLAVGTPAVASPVGVNSDILAGDRVGLAAGTEDQWYAAIRRLLADPDLRTKMGIAGRELVTRRYSIEANLPRLEHVLATGESPD